MTVNFDRHLFNPLYWHIDAAFKDPSIRFVFIYGGSSAAKTYSMVQRVVVEALAEGNRTMVVRKFSTDIDDSIYADFKKVISDWELDPLYRIIRRQIESKSNGLIRFRGLDDSEKIKGISSFKRVLLEEMTQFDYEDFKQTRKRLRGMPGQQIVGLWNPIDEGHWIKKHVLDNEQWIEQPKHIEGIEYSELSEESFKRINVDGDMMLIKTTYLDNYWVVGHPDGEHGFYDEHTVKDFERDKKFDRNYYNIYALGDWGKLDTGAEFYRHFRPNLHTGKVDYNPELPLHLSFDENVNPHPTCTVWQAEGKRAWQIDEICPESPNNSFAHVVMDIKSKYKNHQAGMFLYGDSTSRKSDAKLEKGYNLYRVLKRDLKQYSPQVRVPKANPSVVMRGEFINRIFFEEYEGIEVVIADHCKKSIDDVKYVKQAPDGKKFKEMVTDSTTGVRYEKYGHCSDSMDYFLCRYFETEYNKYRKGR
ncbi:phage terminase large subunit [Limibacter armeniacum]|uniref:phage terminase large subunit n=1 Tax=Limibacter armeniacum TaxID=466084 RepID=UPI002FE5709F